MKPKGKTAKKLNKQIKKQLKKKRKAKAKANVKVFVIFVPAGVAGVPNSQPSEDQADQAAQEEVARYVRRRPVAPLLAESLGEHRAVGAICLVLTALPPASVMQAQIPRRS